jgi:hypothetical protein
MATAAAAPTPRTYRAETIDCIYEYINSIIDRDTYMTIVKNLCERGFMERLVSSDGINMYKAKSELNWSNIAELLNPVERKILLQLVENPKCFFVLFNTQKGKLRISGQEMATWAELPFESRRVVSILVVDNDRTLSEQSVNGLFNCFPLRTDHATIADPLEKYNVRIFELSSNSKISLREILTYIDAYAFNPSYPMPLIVVLANNKQMEKLLRILMHIKRHICTKLCAGTIWDEADKTYPQFREKNFTIDHVPTNFLQFINEHENKTIFRCGFVTATEGELIEDEYDECANAYHYPIVMDPADKENYFAFHHPECKKEYVIVRSGESNNAIAERVLAEKWDKLCEPYLLPDGSVYHHKIIINSNSNSEDMRTFAQDKIDRFNVMTFNMAGVTLYTSACSGGKKYPTRKQNLNRLLFYIYKMNRLNDKPLIILGRRKVDRGLGFHYAPRARCPRTLVISGIDGDCHTDGSEGLIWTDMILGNKIVDNATAVQKAGRAAGIIRQCPQYPKEIKYWVCEETADMIDRHYKKVDVVNELVGSNTIKQAMTQAEEAVPIVRNNHNVDLNLFRVVRCATDAETLATTKRIVEEVLHETYRRPHIDAVTGKYKTSLNNKSDVVDLLDAIKKVPGAYGTNCGVRTYRRFLACYHRDILHCVIPLIDPAYTATLKSNIDETFGAHFVAIPREGEIP